MANIIPHFAKFRVYISILTPKLLLLIFLPPMETDVVKLLNHRYTLNLIFWVRQKIF